MEKIKNFYSKVINGWIYPVFIAATVLLTHTFSLEILGISIIALSAILGLFVCNYDLKFIISPAIMLIFSISEKSSNLGNGPLFSVPSLIAIAVISTIFVISITIYFIKNRNHYDFKKVCKSPLFWGFVVLSITFATNGWFDSESFSWLNLGFTVALILSYIGFFTIFYISIDFSKDFRKYLVFVLFVASILVTVEFYSLFLNGQIKFDENGEMIKESIITGWGIWNTMGNMLTLLLPVHFYIASYFKKYGFIFYITGLISYLAVVLTLSRSSLLSSTILLGICAILSCFIGVNKKINRIITMSLVIVGSVGILLLWDKISNILGDYISRGLDDNGRFDIYLFGLNKFIEHPVFGGGFYNAYHVNTEGLPFCYHNTIIQMLASCGTVGFLAYVYHRFETIKLIWKKRSGRNIFLFLCICGLLITSLLDVHMFSIYPVFYYSLILIAIEKSPDKKTKADA